MPIDLTNLSQISQINNAGQLIKVKPSSICRFLTGTGKTTVGFFNKNQNTLATLATLHYMNNDDVYQHNTNKLHYKQFDFDPIEYTNFQSDNIKDLNKTEINAKMPYYSAMLNDFEAIAWDISKTAHKKGILNPAYTMYIKPRIQGLSYNDQPKLAQADLQFSIGLDLIIAKTGTKSADLKNIDYIRHTFAENWWSTINTADYFKQNVNGHKAVVLHFCINSHAFSHAKVFHSNIMKLLLADDHVNNFIFSQNDLNGNGKKANPSEKSDLYEALSDDFTKYYENENVYPFFVNLAQTVMKHSFDKAKEEVNFIDSNYDAYTRKNKLKPYVNDVHYAINCLAYNESNFIENATPSDFMMINKVLTDLRDAKHLSIRNFNEVSSSHLRLMLANQLSNLKAIKDNGDFYKFNPQNKQMDALLSQSKNYSTEQKALIKTLSPLTVGAAGAGTGKSHTVTGRLTYLKTQNEDLTKVLILSFTNTAANNIKNRFPGIRSLTLADLFNQIYQATFTHQILSSPITLSNTISMINPKSPVFSNMKMDPAVFIDKFTNLINDLEPTGFKRVDLNIVTGKLASFIAENFDDVLTVLDAVKQTTLAIQPIIINAALSNGYPTLNIPKEFRELHFIITDESQDISTFEYILLMTLTINYKANLMIVGDGSQTLYEFRNSNPEFLSAIEDSGIFDTFNLTTNYRSDKAILLYVNQFLKVIKANEHAKIQLKPASFAKLSLPMYHKQVQIHDVSLYSYDGSPKNRLLDAITEQIKGRRVLDWVIDKLLHQQQIAILGFTNDMVDKALEVIVDALNASPKLTKSITSARIKPKRQKTSTLISYGLSHVIERDTIDKLPVSSAHDYVDGLRHLFFNMVSNFKNNPMNYLPSYIEKAIARFEANDLPAHIAAVNAGKLAEKDLSGITIQYLIDFEIAHNSIRSMLKAQDEDTSAYQRADIVGATVHSAKGLEFDNTIVLYDESNRNNGHQDTLRLMHVALTRAKHNELIINFVKSIQGRSVTDDYMGMMSTPISSAQLQAVNELKNAIAAKTNKPSFTTTAPTTKLATTANQSVDDDSHTASENAS